LASGNNDDGGSDGPSDFTPGPASEAIISLSQAILAPLDALAKAQVHAARSFLNLVLQIGYPEGDAGSSYSQKFKIDGDTGGPIEIAVPTLALVPLQPLGIETANFTLEMVIREVAHHQQMQASKVADSAGADKSDMRSQVDGKGMPPHEPRPWYLVSEPVSVRGTLSAPGDGETTQKLSSIKMDVKLSRLPTPAGLQKLLTSMTQHSRVITPQTPPSTPEKPSSS
jgi:hypothetical protein